MGKKLATGKIVVRKKLVYGAYFYDADNELAKKLLAVLTRSDGSSRLSFVRKNLEAYKDMGFDVYVKKPTYSDDEMDELD